MSMVIFILAGKPAGEETPLCVVETKRKQKGCDIYRKDCDKNFFKINQTPISTTDESVLESSGKWKDRIETHAGAE